MVGNVLLQIPPHRQRLPRGKKLERVIKSLSFWTMIDVLHSRKESNLVDAGGGIARYHREPGRDIK